MNINKPLNIFLCTISISLFSLFTTTSAFAFSGSGSGTSSSPYQVTTCAQLQEVANSLSSYYQQQNDIDCTGYDFTPIGSSSSKFTGTYDGNEYKITNLTINKNQLYVGIFGYIGSSGVVTKVGYVSGSVTGGSSVGNMGGIAAVSEGSITKSYSNVDIYGTDGGLHPNGGGIVGYNFGTVSDSYATGNVQSTGSGDEGGLVGVDDGGTADISNSYATGNITGGSTIGGLVGYVENGGSISYSFSTGSVDQSVTNRGGLVGISGGNPTADYWYKTTGSPSNCYQTGDYQCTSETTLSYFYTVTNPPMNNWDFNTIWSNSNNGTVYPVFQWQATNPTPTTLPSSSSNTSSNSSSPSGCGGTVPIAPNLFQVNSTGTTATLYFVPILSGNTRYYISYGLDSSAIGFGTTLNNPEISGVIAYTINDLFAGTWYFKVRGQNGCMPGNWSQVVSVNVFPFSSNINSSISKNVLGVFTNKGKLTACLTYTVQPGDSLWEIANNNLGEGIFSKNIMQKNDLKSSLIYPGQKLNVGC